jgi:UPF0755 protein
MINRLLRALFILVTIGALIVGGATTLLARTISQPVDPTDDEVTEFVVDEGSTVTDIANLLQDDGFISQPLLFRLLAREQQVDSLKAGTYRLRKNMTMSEIIALLSEEREGEGGDEVELQIIEGERVEQVARKIAEAGFVDNPDQFLSVVRNAEPFKEKHPRLQSIPEDQGLEGYLFPNTYRFFTTDTVTDVVDRLITQGFDTAFEGIEGDITARNGEGNDPTVHEIVTMASIVQREAANVEEMPHLAHIFWNRLTPEAAAEVANRLQADPTVQYALGNIDDPWPNLDERLTREEIDNYESPYNTYLNPGLPPGPIANPGADALRAAAQPLAQRPDGTNGEADLYFVLACSEERAHVFAATNNEFNQYVAEYQNCPLFE